MDAPVPCKPGWADIREFMLLLIGYGVGFALLFMGQKDAGTKTIDLVTGAVLMYLKGRTA